jgi:DUF2946 family protein
MPLSPLTMSAQRPGTCQQERVAMRWFRSNIRCGARLALFALGFQLALTFGHVHLDGVVLGKTAPAAVANYAGMPAADPSQKTHGSSDFDCPICALIQLAGTSAPSVAPVLPVPTVFAVVEPTRLDQLQWAASPDFSFQARAPPAI